jgi:RNA polymerase sigma-70 factor (ECF subfamily)
MPFEKDLALARSAAGGERAAFDALFERYAERVYRFLLARSAGRSAAEEGTEKALLRVFAELPDYAGTGSLDAWVLERVRKVASEGETGRPRTPR